MTQNNSSTFLEDLKNYRRTPVAVDEQERLFRILKRTPIDQLSLKLNVEDIFVYYEEQGWYLDELVEELNKKTKTPQQIMFLLRLSKVIYDNYIIR